MAKEKDSGWLSLATIGKAFGLLLLAAVSCGAVYTYAQITGKGVVWPSWSWPGSHGITYLDNSNYEQMLLSRMEEPGEDEAQNGTDEHIGEKPAEKSVLVVECADCTAESLGLAELARELKKHGVTVLALNPYSTSNGSSCLTSLLHDKSLQVFDALKLWTWKEARSVPDSQQTNRINAYRQCRKQDADFPDQFEEAFVKPPVMTLLMMPAANQLADRPLGRALMAIYPKFLWFDNGAHLLMADVGLSGKRAIDAFVKDAKSHQKVIEEKRKANLEAAKKADRESVNTLPGSVMAGPPKVETPFTAPKPLPFMALRAVPETPQAAPPVETPQAPPVEAKP